MFHARFQPLSEVRAELNRLQREMNRVFQRYDGNGNRTAGFPPLNLWEDENHLYVEAELPGMDLQDLEIYVSGGNQLTLKGERKQPTVEKGNWHRQERGYGQFSRTIELPDHVDADQVEASFKHGVLLVQMAKREEAKPRRITVKAE